MNQLDVMVVGRDLSKTENEYPITDLAVRPGGLGGDMDIDANGENLYFTWWDEIGDIWVMDVAEDEAYP